MMVVTGQLGPVAHRLTVKTWLRVRMLWFSSSAIVGRFGSGLYLLQRAGNFE